MSQLRQEYCGLKKKSTRRASEDPAASSKRREAIEIQLEMVRSQFWKLSDQKLRENLNAINARDFPELKAGVDRLQLLAMYRQSITELGKHKKRETNLYNTFRRIVMVPPREAGEIKERYLRAFATSNARENVFLMIKMMEKEYPELYALEADWFRQITKIKKRSAQAASQGGSGGDWGIPGWMIWFGFLMLIRFVYRIVALISDSVGNSSP